ncbi:MFS transporter [Gymnodinialimonas ulvae]|uniref:MFS transporter n=1 Tax=Gymnodinialimonas ulvae TaxID=3126504 RepID=UPI0030B54985
MSVLPALSISRRAMLGFVAMGLFWGSFAAHVPVLKDQIGADDALFGLVLLGSPIGLLLTMWLAPAFDRRLQAWSLPVSAVLLALAYLIPGVVTTPVVFFSAMVALGLTSGVLDIVSNARVSELETETGKPLMNANHGMFSVAYALSAIATGFTREAGIAPVTVFATLSVLVIASAWFMRMEVHPVDEDERRSVHLPMVIVLLCGGIVLTAFFVEAVVESWSALHIERTLGGNPAEGALGPAILGLTMAAGRFSGQAVSGRVTDRTIIAWGSGIACIGALIAALAPTPVVAYVGFGLMGLGVSVVGPLALALVGRLVPRAHRATAVARVNVIGFAAFFLAPMVMGFVSDSFGLRVAFAVVAVLALASPFMVQALQRR